MTNLVLERLKSPAVIAPEQAWEQLGKLLNYVAPRRYEGHDVFDGLNSFLFKRSPLYKSSLLRLCVIQFCKQSPVDLRRLLWVPKGFNPKGGALFLLAYLNMLEANPQPGYLTEARALYRKLMETRIPREVGSGWGYNFDWQARAFYVPLGTPNLVTSVYVGRALLAYAERFDEPDARAAALEIADFLLHEMVKFETDTHLCFNYIPGKDAEVHNANLLGASYLAEVLACLPAERQPKVREQILKSVQFSLADLQENGAWPYGTKPFHRWVDNFHTAYNIESLLNIRQHLGVKHFDENLEKITTYWLNHLFTEEGEPKYYDHQQLPLDVHVIAEAILLLNRLQAEDIPLESERVDRISERLREGAMAFQDPKAGFFYYQKTSRGWNRIPYIRWGQAWMAYALSSCLH